MIDLPDIALSVRQPWTWAIVHGGKRIENRSTVAVSKGDMKPRRICIHAGKGMTRDEYESAAAFMAALGVTCPPASELLRGGIIGVARVIRIVKESDDPWFFGPRGLVLDEVEPVDFIGCSGQLGFFRWSPSGGLPEAPARWMLPKPACASVSIQPDLLL